MERQALVKPDGRALTLYGRRPIVVAAGAVPSPFTGPLAARAHLRWHPLRGEWVTYAAHRQERTFLPPPEYDPLAPTTNPAAPSEVPGGEWDVAVFDNRFPSLGGGVAGALPQLDVPTASADGHCEVVVYTPDATRPLGALPLDHIELVLSVWADRTRRLGARPDVGYVMAFENRGVEVGATLGHAHGQIYAYPFVPPVPQRMESLAEAHYGQHGSGLLATLLAQEREQGTRMLYDGPHAVAFVPVCARYPYECWIAPAMPVARFCDLGEAQLADLARALKTVLMKLDGLWQRPMPYLMTWYQAPTDGAEHPASHLHAVICPVLRSRDRLKFLAGTELGAGLFAMDALPEDKARELQAVEVVL